jgi:sugar transferase (PEP-CTERM/EpsH1 system associated)
MRVLFLSQIVPYPPHGGVLQRGYNILRELGQRASVHLVAFVHPDELPTEADIADSRRALEQFCEKVEYFPLWAKGPLPQRAVAFAAGICSPRPFSTVAHRSPALQRRLSTLLDGGAFDLVHVDTIALNRFFTRRPRVPAVLTHHNIESMLLERRAAVEPGRLAKWVLERESRKLAAYESVVAPLYDNNLVMSEPDEQLLRQRAPGVHTNVVPNGVDTAYFTPTAQNEETPSVIYTGGMNMLANRDAVVHFLDTIWPSIVAQLPGIRFFAVGQDPPPELRAIARRDERVVVTGKVPDIRPYVRQSAVYIVPIRVGGGTRLKVLDAMASGKAIVSTSVGCEGIAARPGEHLVVADSPAEFAASTVALLRDPARRLGLGAAARRLVERKYAWSVVGGQLLHAYDNAVDRCRARRGTHETPIMAMKAAR